ncbi:MAG TPA: lactate utilization protein [Thermoguttaceae bacterium]|nr:lactate utilization protein [Thermoguttaceae bacterium]
MNSRDTILQRIRKELADVPPVQQPPVPEVWPRTNASIGQLVERFADELQAVQGEIVRCRSMDEARRKLAELMDHSQWKTIGSVDRPVCRELAAEWEPQRVAWAEDDWEPSRLADLPAGMVAADRLLADTGTCLVTCEKPQERLMCYLPPVCIVVARTEQLAEHMPAAWDEIARRTAEPDRRGEFVLITGPSRTADIEKILILGVHGPKRLVVFLIE